MKSERGTVQGPCKETTDGLHVTRGGGGGGFGRSVALMMPPRLRRWCRGWPFCFGVACVRWGRSRWPVSSTAPICGRPRSSPPRPPSDDVPEVDDGGGAGDEDPDAAAPTGADGEGGPPRRTEGPQKKRAKADDAGHHISEPQGPCSALFAALHSLRSMNLRHLESHDLRHGHPPPPGGAGVSPGSQCGPQAMALCGTSSRRRAAPPPPRPPGRRWRSAPPPPSGAVLSAHPRPPAVHCGLPSAVGGGGGRRCGLAAAEGDGSAVKRGVTVFVTFVRLCCCGAGGLEGRWPGHPPRKVQRMWDDWRRAFGAI